MSLTDEQIEEFFRQGLAEGIPESELLAAARGETAAPPASDPIADLQSQFAGTEAIPTESVAPTSDTGFGEMARATLTESVGGPFVGIAETAGIVPEGMRGAIREDFEDKRVDYLSGDPGITRTVLAGLTEGLTQLIPIAPGGAVGRKVAGKVGGAALGKVAGAAAAGATEGAVVAVGDTVGLPTGERLKQGALTMAAAAGLGTLGGLKVTAGDKLGTKDPVYKGFLDRYGAKEMKGKRDGGGLARWRQRWVNRLMPVEKSAQDISAKVGDPEIAELAFIRANQARTADITSNTPIYDGTYDLNGKRTGEALDDIFKDIDIDVRDEVTAYGFARRNIELYDRQRAAAQQIPELENAIKTAEEGLSREPKNQEFKDFLSSAKRSLRIAKDTADIEVTQKSLDESAGLVEHSIDKYGMNPETKEAAVVGDLAHRLTQFNNRAVIDPLTEIGYFDKATADTMKAEGKWYVPFMRELEDVFRNEPGLVSDAAPVGHRIKMGLSEEYKIRDPYQVIGERAIRTHAFVRVQKIRNMVADLADQYPEDIGFEVRPAQPGDKNTFGAYREGERQKYSADQDMLRAVETLSVPEATLALRAARGITRVFRAGATLTPEFAFGNLARDQFPFGVYSKGFSIPFLTPARYVTEELYHMITNKGLNSKQWKDFMRSSGGHSTFVEGDRFTADRHVELLESGKHSAGAGRLKRLARESVRHPLAPLQALSSMFERPSRFAEFRRTYKRAIKAGKGEERALQLAELAGADITLNFQRAGDLGKRWNLYEAFFNASMQDIDKFARAVSSPKTAFATTTKALAWMTIPSLYFWSKFKDDEAYQAWDDWEKALYVPIARSDKGRYYRMPMPPGLLGVMFSYLPRTAAEAFIGQEDHPMQKIMSEFADQTPLQYVPIPGGINPLQDAGLDALPTAAQPLFEIIANHSSFFDRPIVSQRYQGLPVAERKTWRTTNAAVVASGLTGGEFSPLQIDHLISGYGGGLGRKAAEMTGIQDPSVRARKEGLAMVPGLNRFVSTTPYGFSSKPVQDFYDFADASEEAAKGLKLQSNQERYNNFLEAHPEAAYAKEVRKVKKGLSEYVSWRDDVRENKSLSKWEREDALLKVDQEITRYAGETMRSIHDAIRIDQMIQREEQ